MVNQYNECYLGDGCPKNPDLTTMQLLHVKKIMHIPHSFFLQIKSKTERARYPKILLNFTSTHNCSIVHGLKNAVKLNEENK